MNSIGFTFRFLSPNSAHCRLFCFSESQLISLIFRTGQNRCAYYFITFNWQIQAFHLDQNKSFITHIIEPGCGLYYVYHLYNIYII